jgi:hypothetical protein
MYKGTIKNPEAMEKASENFTKLMIQLYNAGKINISADKEKTAS